MIVSPPTQQRAEIDRRKGRARRAAWACRAYGHQQDCNPRRNKQKEPAQKQGNGCFPAHIWFTGSAGAGFDQRPVGIDRIQAARKGPDISHMNSVGDIALDDLSVRIPGHGNNIAFELNDNLDIVPV